VSRYKRGADFERRVKLKLEAAGWLCIRSAGSKGKIDLVAFDAGVPAFIQCKRARLAKAEWDAFVALARAHAAEPIFVHPKKGWWVLDDHPEKRPWDPIG